MTGQRIRIRLKAFDSRVLDASSADIVETAKRTGARVAGPIPLPTRVERFELPKVGALNFVLYDVLAGGASQSLRLDTQGKLLGAAVIELRLPVSSAQLERLHADGLAPLVELGRITRPAQLPRDGHAANSVGTRGTRR